MRRFYLILLVTFVVVVNKPAHSQVVTGAVAGVMLDEMQKKMQSVIEDAENSANNVVNNAAIQANILIGNFRVTYKEALDNTAKTVNDEVYKTLYELKVATDNIFENTNDALDKLETITKTMDQTMSRLPGAKKRPYISRIDIPNAILNDSTNTDDLRITLSGNILDEGEKFKLNGHKIKPSQMYSTQLVYDVPYQLISENVVNNSIHFDLKLKYGGLFLKRHASYAFTAKAVPSQFGTVTVNASVSTKDTIRIHRKETMPATRTGGSNWRGSRETKTQSFTVYPSIPTNIIDVTSIRLKTIANRYGYDASIPTKSASAILIRQKARSDSGPYGGGGKIQSQVTFTEWQIADIPGIHEIQNVPLIYLDPLVIKLPNNTTTINSIVVKLYNGKKITLTTENTNKNFTVYFRNIDKTLFIQNKKLD